MNSEKVTKKQIDLMLKHARERGNQQEVKRLKKIQRMNMANYDILDRIQCLRDSK